MIDYYFLEYNNLKELRKSDEARAPAAMERLIKVAAPRRSAIKSSRNSDFLPSSFSQIQVANAKNSWAGARDLNFRATPSFQVGRKPTVGKQTARKSTVGN